MVGYWEKLRNCASQHLQTQYKAAASVAILTSNQQKQVLLLRLRLGAGVLTLHV